MHMKNKTRLIMNVLYINVCRLIKKTFCKNNLLRATFVNFLSHSCFHLAQPAPGAIKRVTPGFLENVCLQSQPLLLYKHGNIKKEVLMWNVQNFCFSSWMTNSMLSDCSLISGRFCDTWLLSVLFPSTSYTWDSHTCFLFASPYLQGTNISEYLEWQQVREICPSLALTVVVLQAGMSCAGEVWQEGKVIDTQ